MSRLLLFCVLLHSLGVHSLEPNPPSWPSSVSIFDPQTSAAEIQSAVNSAYALNGGQQPNDHGQFSKHRFAFLFKPGHYNVDVPVGYYTQVAGLGTSPTDVVFTSSKGVFCEEGSYSVSPGALDTFWRNAENFQTNADFPWNSNGNRGMIWAASQATSLRRVVVTNDLDLFQFRKPATAAGFASGGYLANSVINKQVSSGSQQQFLSRNNKVGHWSDGVWNMVFVGTENAPSSHCGDTPAGTHPYTTVDAAPAIAEKPFISVGQSGAYTLNIPHLSRDRRGTDFNVGTQVGFEKVYVAKDSDTASAINSKLKQGLHVVLTPGIYSLDAALELNHENQVLLGLGLATLIATNGTPAVQVGNVDGVRVAGILFEAGPKLSDSLLQWGVAGTKYAGKASNPGVATDIYARVGGPIHASGQAKAKIMLRISSGNVIADNSWLWRADHQEGGSLVRNGDNPCQVGVVVDGDDVITYGMKAEHALTEQLQWNGNRGKTFMFQSELPYDVSQASFGDKGYSGYLVTSQVTEHEAHGVGVYHFFRDYTVTVQSAIVAPRSLEKFFFGPLAVFLNGRGKIEHVLNAQGHESAKDPSHPTSAVPQWVCSNSPPSPGPTPPPAPPMPRCKVGDSVICPYSSVACAGNACCPDLSICPSASETFHGCLKEKEMDCIGPSPSPATCNVGDVVLCPDGKTTCAGSQCCPDLSICPSAPKSFQDPTCLPKIRDCTQSSPSPATCRVGDVVLCADGKTKCAGSQCCPDKSICPSAPESFQDPYCLPKIRDCTQPGIPEFLFATLV